ncbi:MAG TPA: MFS transporter [Marinagarivorans sp.]
MISGTPYWRLSAVYFGYFAVIGGLSPYWSAYLDNIGFAPHVIGFLAAIPMITRLLAPYVWGALADASGQPLRVARLGVFGALVSFVALLFSQDFWVLMIASFVFSFFWNAVLPQFEGLTLSHLGAQRESLYSRIRLWGSVGFIVMVLALGLLFDRASIDLLPWCLMVGLGTVALAICLLPPVPRPTQIIRGGGNLWAVLRKPTVAGFFVAVFLLQISHGVYYGFFTLHLQDNGYSRTVISALWSVGVVAEIVLFIYVPRIFARWGLKHCLLLCFAIASIRWLVIGLVPNSVLLLVLVQLGHAFTFGLVHAVAMTLVRTYFGESLQGRGQALYSAVGFGAGAAVGTYMAGWLWHWGGSVTFVVAALIAALAFAVALVSMPSVPCRAEAQCNA